MASAPAGALEMEGVTVDLCFGEALGGPQSLQGWIRGQIEHRVDGKYPGRALSQCFFTLAAHKTHLGIL